MKNVEVGPGRPALPKSERRKPRSVRMADAEWEEIQRRADALGLPISEFIRFKTLTRKADYWKECYEIAINHLKQIENQYFIEHGFNFQYK